MTNLDLIIQLKQLMTKSQSLLYMKYKLLDQLLSLRENLLDIQLPIISTRYSECLKKLSVLEEQAFELYQQLIQQGRQKELDLIFENEMYSN